MIYFTKQLISHVAIDFMLFVSIIEYFNIASVVNELPSSLKHQPGLWLCDRYTIDTGPKNMNDWVKVMAFWYYRYRNMEQRGER